MSNVIKSPKHISKKYIYALTGTVLPLLLVGIFFGTKGTAPATSELAFTEHSVLGKESGSVIPASCNSVPPVSHRPGDCLPVVNVQFGGTDKFVDVTFGIVGQGATNNILTKDFPRTLQWQAPGATTCSINLSGPTMARSRNPDPVVPTTGTMDITNAYTTYGTTTYIYKLTCSNDVKTVSKTINIQVDGGTCSNHAC